MDFSTTCPHCNRKVSLIKDLSPPFTIINDIRTYWHRDCFRTRQPNLYSRKHWDDHLKEAE